ncbi:prepilin-type N-terminal cleavage/methylation domain-containing protein [Microbacterium sulfonylureivorans]|uniref:prepilin-type N-terminal cleavage/methylation domain-containing protein n=1 Tax=Microbacterium sulfonylureivorans TaxID=2486854 RepID=UPI000FD77D2E|nr:prepilin-type N-terminal cleavage/methylation domain-containing protein [Microbacterium sulfonylureivorans]
MSDSKGFSIVEVIVAMFLLMVLALAVLPLIIGATNTSVVNRDLVAATTFANAQVAPIKAAFPNDPGTPTSCATLQGRAAVDVQDTAGTGLQADTAIGACPSVYPGAVLVTVVVEDRAAPGEAVTRLATRVSVSAP